MTKAEADINLEYTLEPLLGAFLFPIFFALDNSFPSWFARACDGAVLYHFPRNVFYSNCSCAPELEHILGHKGASDFGLCELEISNPCGDSCDCVTVDGDPEYSCDCSPKPKCHLPGMDY